VSTYGNTELVSLFLNSKDRQRDSSVAVVTWAWAEGYLGRIVRGLVALANSGSSHLCGGQAEEKPSLYSRRLLKSF
jgi:hypothetical protein